MKTHRRSVIQNPKRMRCVKVMCKIAIPDAHLNDALETVRAWYGVHLRKSQLLAMARRNGALALNLADLPTDTETRETIACEVGKIVTGTRWPIFADGPAAWTRFAETFNALAAKKGIRLERLLDVKPPRPRPRRMARCGNAVPSSSGKQNKRTAA